MKERKREIVRARIEVELKENVEKILDKLGLTHSEAIRLFYAHVILNGGIAFDLKGKSKVDNEKT